jgi:hypothetical protein
VTGSTISPLEESLPGWRLTFASAPWYGVCNGSCNRELGWPKPELAARRLDASPHGHTWLCVPCVTEAVRADFLRAMEAELAGMATRRGRPNNPDPKPR